jgi:hypothetical protein
MPFDYEDRKIRLKRSDTELANLKIQDSIKQKLDEKYRSDTHLGTILKREGVSSQSQLEKKYKK